MSKREEASYGTFMRCPRRRAQCYVYDQFNGEHMFTYTCSTESLFDWAERRAIPEEISQLREWKRVEDTGGRKRALGLALWHTKG
jgi:hypothetical protein